MMRQHAFLVFITFVIHLFDVILDKVENKQNDMNTRPEVKQTIQGLSALSTWLMWMQPWLLGSQAWWAMFHTACMYQHALASSHDMFLRFLTSFKIQLWWRSLPCLWCVQPANNTTSVLEFACACMHTTMCVYVSAAMLSSPHCFTTMCRSGSVSSEEWM